MTLPYENVPISLGESCIVKANLDTFFETKVGEPAPAFIFDWLMGGGLNGVARALSSDLNFKKDDFELQMINKNWWVPTHKPTGFNFLHEFRLDNKFDDPKEVEAKFDAHFGAFSKKFDYLKQKTRDYFSSQEKKSLWYWGNLKKSDFLQFMNSIPLDARNTCDFLNIYNVKNPPKNRLSEVTYIPIDHCNTLGWRGDVQGWQKIFSDYFDGKNGTA